MNPPVTVSAQTDRFVHDRLPPPDAMPELLFDAPELQFPPQINLVQELLDKAPLKGFADRPMLRSETETLSYAEARVRVDRIAHVLVQDLGLVPGNRVLLRGGNSIAMALAMLAVMKAGMIAVATMPLLRASELGNIIAKSEPAVALCDVLLLKELQLAQADHPVLQTLIHRQTWRIHRNAYRSNRHRIAGLHLGHHRQAQGCRAYPPRRVGGLRGMAASCPVCHVRGRGHGFASVGVHLRPRWFADFPDVGWRGGIFRQQAVYAGRHGEADA